MIATADLPDDIVALKAIILAQQKQNAVQADVIDRNQIRINQLEKFVADYKRAMFGARSEKTCPEQYELALEDIEAARSCSWMRPPRRCSIPVSAKLGRGTSRPWCVMTGHAAARIHLVWPLPMRRSDPGNMRRAFCRASVAPCRLTGMPGKTGS